MPKTKGKFQARLKDRIILKLGGSLICDCTLAELVTFSEMQGHDPRKDRKILADLIPTEPSSFK